MGDVAVNMLGLKDALPGLEANVYQQCGKDIPKKNIASEEFPVFIFDSNNKKPGSDCFDAIRVHNEASLKSNKLQNPEASYPMRRH